MIKLCEKIYRKIVLFQSKKPVLGIGLIRGAKQKRVLISYLSDFKRIGLNSFPFHTNRAEASVIVGLFVRNGFVVDLIDCDYDFTPTTNYDVIFGFGVTFRKLKSANFDAKYILYLTENIPLNATVNEDLAINGFNERHCRNETSIRSGRYYVQSDLLNNDRIILLGDKERKESVLKMCEKVDCLYPSGLYNRRFVNQRDLGLSKFNFLWFGSGGAILKGLDILLDIFATRDDITLHVAGLNLEEKKILQNVNYVDHGKVDVNSDEFLKLCNLCSFSILPSWSEASSTAILTTLRHGMIPLISKNCGLNGLGGVYYFNSISFHSIESVINEVLQLEATTLDKLHVENFNMYNDFFGLKSFESTFSTLIDNI